MFELARWLGEGALLVLAVVALFLASTVVFDAVHFLLHVLARSRLAPLRWVGSLHEAHHLFLDRNLDLRPEYLRKNIYLHVIPEFLTQMTVSVVLLRLLPGKIVFPVMGIQLLVFLLILRLKGIDINHRPIAVLRAYRPMYFCVPEYHALHHVYPDSYFSSWIKTLDHLLGTGTELRGRRISLTGAAAPFGAALKRRLEERYGGEVSVLESADLSESTEQGSLARRLKETDILILTHTPEQQGEVQGMRDSYSALIERYREFAAARKVPIEVWALASGFEASEGTRDLTKDSRIIYRHLSIDAPPPEATAVEAAQRALFWISRGFNRVPI